MSEFVKRDDKTRIFPYLEYRDEKGNRYFIDTLSMPWFYLFFQFRHFFPVNAILLKDNYVDIYRAPLKITLGKTILWIIQVILISRIAKNIIDILLILHPISYLSLYRTIIVFIDIVFIILVVILRRKVFKSENLENQIKVRIRLRFKIKVFLYDAVCLFLLYGVITLNYSSEIELSTYQVFGLICMGLFTVFLLTAQWKFLNFSSKDVKFVRNH